MHNPAGPATPTGTLRVKGASMGRTEHKRSPEELRKAVAWFGPVVDHAIAEANAPHGAVFALSLPVGS